MADPTCIHCGGGMKKITRSTGNCAGIAVALIVFVVGIVIAVAIPVVGWVVGPIICICALFMGGKRTKAWQCVDCQAFVERG